MAQVGGELVQMETLRASFDQNKVRVGEITSEIDRKLADTIWTGPAAERFKNAWNSEFKSALTKLGQALEEAGLEVKRRKEAIEQATS